MSRWSVIQENVRRQIELLKAQRDRSKGRPRPKVQLPPPSHVLGRQAEGSRQVEPVVPGAVRPVRKLPRLARRQKQVEPADDVLAKLLQTDVVSQQLAEKLWWKWRHIYLPARRRELAARRHVSVVEDEDQELEVVSD